MAKFGVICCILLIFPVALTANLGKLKRKIPIKLATKSGSVSAHLRQDDCSSFLTDMQGEIRSPNYPGDYPNNALCTWEIEVPEDYRIRLTFTEFRLEASADCQKDFVEVYDGSDFKLFCGRDKPEPVDSVANVMSILFESDEAIHAGDKFLAEYVAFQGELTTSDTTGTGTTPSSITTASVSSTTTGGGGGGDSNCTLTFDVSDPEAYGFFSTPDHPENYPSGASCRWEIIATNSSESSKHSGLNRPSNKKFSRVDYVPETRVGFLRFKTAAGDAANVFLDGEETASDSIEGDMQIDNEDHTIGTKTYRSSQDNITLTFNSKASEAGFLFFAAKDLPRVFTSDDYLKGLSKNFRRKSKKSQVASQIEKLTEKAARKNLIKINMSTGKITASEPRLRKLANFGKNALQQEVTDYGVFMSPNHPDFYNNHEMTTFEFTAPAGKKVAIYFARFNTEPQQDWLIVRDVQTDDQIFLSADGVEEILPDKVYLSISNQIEAVFNADQAITSTGFLAAFAAVDA